MAEGHDQGRRELGSTDRSSKPCPGCSVPSGPGAVSLGEAGSEGCRACRKGVRGTIVHVLHLWGISLQEQDREDLIEEVFLKAIMSGHPLLPKPGQRWPGLGLVCNAIRALVRRRSRSITGERAALAISHAVGTAPDPELAAECEETRSSLPEWIRHLPSARREAYTLIALIGMTVEKAAIQMDRSKGAVARLYQRALQDLRRQAERNGDRSDTFR